MTTRNLIIGVDTGVNTGLAIWNTEKQYFEKLVTCGIISAMQEIISKYSEIKLLIFEDARLRKWFGKKSVESLQGAGSIKRDSSIWQEFCEYYSIEYQAVAPKKWQTKWNSDYFKKVTGWNKRTSEHSRDAAMLVFGMR